MPDNKNKLEAKGIVEKILNDRAERERFKEIAGEKYEEYKQALNGMAATPNGQYFLQFLTRYCGVFAYQSKLDPARMVEENGMRRVYLEAIRPHLIPESREVIER